MERLGDISVSFPRRREFEQHPVWAEDEGTDNLRPVLHNDPLPEDLGLLLIRARFETPDGLALDGTVTWLFGVYAFGVFVGDQKIVFNMNMDTQTWADSVRKLREALGQDDIPIFPLKYWTEHHVENEPNLAGVFDSK